MKNIYNITHEIEEELVKQSFLAMGYSSPNPPVGCVLSDLEGNILSKGHTQKTGFDHAEISAYNNFTKTGVSHNVFVTLEPCTHTGKTPPCADTILKKRPESVFYGLKDPNPLVVDSSFEKKYSDEKIDISKSDEIQKIAKAYLNGFLSRIHFGRPAVLVKIVETKEGFFGSQDESVRISSPESDNMSQLLRAKFDGIIVGPKTISMDKPLLDFRKIKSRENNYKVTQNENLFFSNLFSISGDDSVISFHSENSEDYQPFRIFVLSREEEVSEDFLIKQFEINEKHKSKKAIFFLLDSRRKNINCISEKTIINLKKLTLHEIFPISEEEIPSKIFDSLKKLELNTLIVEGGNLLYRAFTKNLSRYDSILKITGNSVSLKKGILPELNYQNTCRNFRAEIGRDTWEVFGCLPES